MSLELSVVLPYYENQRTLAACLRHLAAQTLPLSSFEVIVVDDGSVSPAASVLATTPHAPSVQILRTVHGGQSAATNVGIVAARAPFVLLTCADMMAHPRLLEEHLQAHRRETPPVAVLGAIPYLRELLTTPFMRYLSGPGPQFVFETITDAQNVDPRLCYAPNFSARRDALQRIGMFDEGFKYGFQDTDLGMRLAASGLRTVYNKDAVAYHDHPSTLRSFVQRQKIVGKALLHMLRKHPSREERDKARHNAVACYPHLHQLDAMVEGAEQIEKKISHTPDLAQALQPQLNALYHRILAIALVSGMLSDRVAAGDMLGADIMRLGGDAPSRETPIP